MQDGLRLPRSGIFSSKRCLVWDLCSLASRGYSTHLRTQEAGGGRKATSWCSAQSKTIVQFNHDALSRSYPFMLGVYVHIDRG